MTHDISDELQERLILEREIGDKACAVLRRATEVEDGKADLDARRCELERAKNAYAEAVAKRDAKGKP